MSSSVSLHLWNVTTSLLGCGALCVQCLNAGECAKYVYWRVQKRGPEERSRREVQKSKSCNRVCIVPQ